MQRILYLSPNPAPPVNKPQENVFHHLSRYFCGDVLAPIWWKKNAENIQKVQDANLGMGNFHYHAFFRSNKPKLVNNVLEIAFYLFKGLYLHYAKGRYDVVVAYGLFKTGLVGYLFKKCTGTKLIIDVPGNPRKSFMFESEVLSRIDSIKMKIGNVLAQFVVKRADHIKLLYPGQLNGFTTPGKSRISIFHDMVPITVLNKSDSVEKYILFLGHPFFLKGVDILIKAFQAIIHQFPDYRLKIVGFCPDKVYFQTLAEGNDRIELCDPVSHNEAMRLMSKCSLFVLPSRTEAMGRVLLEAMAFGKPIIASNIDGIPHYIKNGFNGLLFKVENVNDLAKKMKTMLGDPDYAIRLAENAYKFVRSQFSEERFVECFKGMVDTVSETSQKQAMNVFSS